MTRRLLVATGGTSGTGPLDPEDPDPPANPWETDLSPTWDSIVRVGPSRTYTNITAGWAAAGAAPGRVAVVVDPGTYTIPGDYIDSPGNVDLVGATADRDDVVIVAGSGGGNNYIANVSGHFYCAHVTLRVPDVATAGKSYAIHMTWTDPSASTNIFENVHIDDLEPTRTGGFFGWDAPDGSLLYLKDCLVDSPRSTVLHGDDDTTGVRLAYEDSVFNVASLLTHGFGWNTAGCTLNGSPVTPAGTIPPTIVNGVQV